MSQLERPAAQEAIADLGDEDRDWLLERLSEYQGLLQYLHDH